MKKVYEIPELDILRFAIPDSLTSSVEEGLSGPFDFGEDVEEW